MERTKIATALLCCLASTVGCKKDENKGEAKPTPSPVVKAPVTAPTTPAKEWSGADTAKAYADCSSAFNAKDEAKFLGCYASDADFAYVDFAPPMTVKGAEAIGGVIKMWWGGFPDAKGEAQLVLVNGNEFAAINLMTQTNTGEAMGMPATGKQTVAFEAQSGSFDADGKFTADNRYADQATMAHQMGMFKSERSPDSETAWAQQTVVIAANDDREKANLEFIKGLGAVVEAHDAAAMLAAVTDDISFRYVGDKKAVSGKVDYEKGMKKWMAMSKVTKRDVKSSWAAGDWIFVQSQVTSEMLMDMPGAEGTKGKSVTLAQTEFFQVADSKIKTHWIFENTMQYPIQLGMMDPSKMGGHEAAAK